MGQRVVTISGSYRKHFDRLLEAKEQFEQAGCLVLRPHTDQVEGLGGEFVRLAGDPEDLAGIQRAQLEAIDRSSLLYVVNPGGYVGSSATGEAFWAAAKSVPVVLAEEPYEKAVATIASGFGNENRSGIELALDLLADSDERGV